MLTIIGLLRQIGGHYDRRLGSTSICALEPRTKLPLLTPLGMIRLSRIGEVALHSSDEDLSVGTPALGLGFGLSLFGSGFAGSASWSGNVPLLDQARLLAQQGLREQPASASRGRL